MGCSSLWAAHLLTITVVLSRFRVSERGRGNPSGQRSFNWQSTAFVMRGLRVRLPPLALVAAGDDCGLFNEVYQVTICIVVLMYC